MPSNAWLRGTLSVSVAVATGAAVGIVCLMLRWICPGYCVLKGGRWYSRVRLAARRGMCMSSELEAMIDAINVELEAGNWSQVVALTTALYSCAVAEGEAQLAELVQDLHW